MRRIFMSVMLIGLLAGLLPGVGLAEAPANDAFQRTWERTDQPVLSGNVSRTWMWGPEASTGALSEPYSESPGGERTVQYFDKARMEITTPDADPNSIWYVTNGLLVVELITGQMQAGNADFTSRSAAEVNVAGDAGDPDGPTYATFGALLDAAPSQAGDVVTSIVDRNANVSEDPDLVSEGVTVSLVDDVTNHAIAAPFWDFMNSTGMVLENGQLVQASLFENAYFATGRPVTEPYWANVEVGGTERLVLLQCFERRCLTYTPDNPEGWQVEAGNVGQHYYTWRYGDDGPTPPGEPDENAIECLREGFPCTLADTPPDALDNMYALGRELGGMLEDGVSIANIADYAADQPGVVQVLSSPTVLRFRVENAPPAWVFKRTDIPEEEQEQGDALNNVQHPLIDDFDPVEVVGKDRDNDDMTDEEPKKALVLSPYQWELSPYDAGEAIDALLSETRGYEGNVEYYRNFEDEDGSIFEEVTFGHFSSWALYDVVYVYSHAAGFCEDIGGGDLLCESGISSGYEVSRDEADEIDVFGGETWFPDGETHANVFLSSAFFENAYGDGLENTIVFLAGCETYPQDFDSDSVIGSPIPQILSGDSSVVAGIDSKVWGDALYEFSVNVFTYAINNGFPFDEAVEDMSLIMGPSVNVDEDGIQYSARLNSRAGGDDLRIREVVTQKHPLTDEEVEDGDALPIMGSFSDGEEDRLPFVVEIDGITDPSGVTIHVEINGNDRPETFGITADDLIEDNTYRLDEADVPLGFDAQEEQQIELRLWVDLPEGGESKHTTNVQLDNPIIEFRSIMESSNPGGDIRSEVHAEFTLIYNEDFTEFETGTTELEYVSYDIDFNVPQCEVVTETTDGTLEIVRTDFPTGEEGRISSLVPNEIALRPLTDIFASTTAVCPQGSIEITDQDIHWFASWVVMHGGADGSLPGAQNEFSLEDEAWVIEDWQEKPIQKVYEQRIVDTDTIFEETTTIEITMPDE